MRKILLYLFLVHGIVLQSFAQDTSVSGTIIDSKTELPLLGATINVKGTSNGAVSDFDGSFTLLNVPSGAVLSVKFIGYISKDVPVNNQSSIKITLDEDVQSLDEVIVVGYGVQTKRDLTGAVGSIKGEAVAIAPTSNFDQALAGRIAGVQVTSSDGTPGGATNIVIRGGNSITGDNSPLYVVDGVPFEDFDPATLNSDDVKSYDVLKDASSTAIYGARGANGVIIVTTKDGRTDGKTDVTFKITSGIQYAPSRLEVLNPFQFVTVLEQNALTRDNFQPGENVAAFLENWVDPELYRNIEGKSWQDEIFRTASFKNYNVTVSGGGKDTQVYYSGQHVDQEGIVLNTEFRKTVNNLKVKHKVNDWLKLDANLTYSLANRVGPSTSPSAAAGQIIRDALVFRPVAPVNDDGIIGLDVEDPVNTNIYNPVSNLVNTDRQNRTEDIRASLKWLIQFSKTLSLNTIGSYRSSINRRSSFNGADTYWGSRDNGINGSLENSRRATSTVSAVLNYIPKLSEGHRLTVLGGVETQTSKFEVSRLTASQIPTDVFGIANLGIANLTTTPTTGVSENVLLSYFGRVNYNLKKRYLFQANFRADASSKFRKENRWGYFPSFSLGWAISEEPFFENVDFISNLKFRGGWGKTGNNRIGDFTAFTTLNATSQSGYVWGDNEYVLGATVDNLGTPTLKWETTDQYNVGLDFSLFKNKIQGSVDYYLKRTKDLLLNANVASSTGFTTIQQNIGEVENKGLEFSLSSYNISNKNFKWTTDFNIAFNRNKIIALNKGEPALFSAIRQINNGNEFAYVSEVGKPVGQMYGLLFDGLYQLEDFNTTPDGRLVLKDGVPSNGLIGPGTTKYKDISGPDGVPDGLITDHDRTIIGNGTPDFTGGLTNTFSYKGVELSVFLQYSYGSDVLNVTRQQIGAPNLGGQNRLVNVLNQWTPTNPNTVVPVTRFNPTGSFGGAQSGTQVNDSFVEDGSFIRLKTVSLGYRVPKKFLKNAFIKSARFFVSAQNLFTWTNYTGYDPEVSVSSGRGPRTLTPNIDWSAYPQQVTITSGLNFSF